MTTTTLAPAGASVQTHTQVQALPLMMAALLGLLVIGFVGFSHIEAVHNAGHDYRHSMAFPCH
ncbi:CbtB-domain containing protein [Tianweitania sp. BSSL-BM11]|uniref:CbtB-domain containing protein n=1 Tax=Tianweitania aestuarii TaxID=2814886 RepID=A0ABS5RUB5_9HYPH|nr:CbtB-domain containing protein [Tianweitania aestuarii]MBS9720596.1 CbtB-domain containing protein [Tianweitania aestuarii]